MSRKSELKVQQLKRLPQILLIDDEPMNLEVLSSLLLTRGHESDKAFSGELGLHLIKKRFELAKRGRA